MGRVNKKLTRNRPGDLVGFFGSGLVGFGLIRVGFEFITGDEIWPDPARFGRNLIRSVDIWPRFRRVTAGSRRIWSENRNTSPVRINDRFGSGVTGLETKNR